MQQPAEADEYVSRLTRLIAEGEDVD